MQENTVDMVGRETVQKALLKKAQTVSNGMKYIAVVGDTVVQRDDILEFIGRCIEMLQSYADNSVRDFLFDGDLFQLQSKGKYNHFLIGTVPYEIKETGSEVEMLGKLDKLFQNFPEVCFIKTVKG